DVRPRDVSRRVVLRAGRARRRGDLLRRLPGLLHRQRAQAVLPGDLGGRTRRPVSREAREGAASHLREVLRELRVREVEETGGGTVVCRAVDLEAPGPT